MRTPIRESPRPALVPTIASGCRDAASSSSRDAGRAAVAQWRHGERPRGASRRRAGRRRRARVGSWLAVCLAKLGVDVLIVDGKQGPTRESRALAVQARSMELYDQLGLVDRVLAERCAGAGDRAGRRSAARSAGSSSRGSARGSRRTPRSRCSSRAATSGCSSTRSRDLGREVRWGHALERLEIVDAGATTSAGGAASVIATLAGPDGEVTVRARYCVGADGSHSRVRESLGIPFEGVTNALHLLHRRRRRA